MRSSWLIIIVLTAGAACFACPPEVYVDISAPPGGDGASWATAFNELQDAVQCLDAKVIHVAEGTYYPGDSGDDFFLLLGQVTVLGGYPAGGGERDPLVHDTRLSGVAPSHQILVKVVNYHSGSATLDGLTLTGVNDSSYDPRSSAVFVENSTVTLRNCRVVDNSAYEGAGLLADEGRVTIVDCHFEGNRATGDCYAVGGAISTGHSPAGGTLDILRTTFVQNRATEFQGCSAGTSHAIGGAIWFTGEGTIVDCRFQNNYCSVSGGFGNEYGGAIAVRNFARAVVVNCEFLNNSAESAGGAIWVGWSDGDTTVANCLFVGNQSEYSGGAIGLFDPERTRIANSTFVDNVPQSVHLLGERPPIVVNSILRGGPEPPIGGDAIVRYSNVSGGYEGRGNIDVDPMLDLDYRLLPGSPCIDAGWSTVIPAWLWGDLDLNPRKVDDPNTPDTGRGEPPIDMGAFEFQP